MNQTEITLYRLYTGDTLSIASLEAADTGDTATYTLNIIKVLGDIDDIVKFNLNGILLELAGGFEINKIPIRTIQVISVIATNPGSSPGLLVIGSKTRTELFGNRNF